MQPAVPLSRYFIVLINFFNRSLAVVIHVTPVSWWLVSQINEGRTTTLAAREKD
jgi:hypothetical protein